jgi:hypothetical protein
MHGVVRIQPALSQRFVGAPSKAGQGEINIQFGKRGVVEPEMGVPARSNSFGLSPEKANRKKRGGPRRFQYSEIYEEDITRVFKALRKLCREGSTTIPM